jgi:hypothetical protein
MVLKRNEDDGGEILASLKQTGFELIPEDDEPLIEDDLSDAIDEEAKDSSPLPIVKPQNEITASATSVTVDGPAGELIAKLGPFQSHGSVLGKPFTEVHCISDWEPLFHRYKQEYMRKFVNFSSF